MSMGGSVFSSEKVFLPLGCVVDDLQIVCRKAMNMNCRFFFSNMRALKTRVMLSFLRKNTTRGLAMAKSYSLL